jgi:hypothetical protein
MVWPCGTGFQPVRIIGPGGLYEQAVVKRVGIDRGIFPSIYSASPHCDAPGNVFEPTPFTGTVFPVA